MLTTSNKMVVIVVHSKNKEQMNEKTLKLLFVETIQQHAENFLAEIIGNLGN
jgi:riboflavin synthase